MPRVHPIVPSLNGGEISPYLGGRVDFQQYPKSLRTCFNTIPLIQGPVTKRPGTRFVKPAKHADKTCRLVPFIFSDDPGDALILEFGDQYVRFFTNRGQVVSGGSAYEVATPYLEADLATLRFAQSADILYIAHGNYAPRKLARTSNTNWTLSTIAFINGPFLDEDEQGTTMTPADTAHLTPDMTANTTPSGTASTSNASATAWQLFDRERAQTVTMDTSPDGWAQYQLAGAAQLTADAYWMTAHKEALNNQDYITEWEFQGSNDGSSWTTLDSRSGETGWRGGETRFYSFTATAPYEYHRVLFRGGGGSDATNSRMAEIAIHLAEVDQTPFNLTASSTAGINNGDGFKTTDVGRLVRLMGGDGVWRVATIVSRTSATVVTITLGGHALPDTSPISRWQLGSWSADTGYPKAVTFYGDRLYWGGSASQPQTFWGSVVGDYENHDISTEDDASLNLTLSSSDVQFIKWMRGDEKGLMVGTTQGEWIVRPSSLNEALSPTNVKADQVTDYGSNDADPVRVAKAVLFAQRSGRKLREMAYVIDVDGYMAPDLTVRAEHITDPSIAQLAYQSQPLSCLWAVRSDGELLGFTYERNQEVTAWHRHRLGGVRQANGNPTDVESIATIPAPDGSQDDLWIVAQRYVNGAVVRHIEYLTELFDHDTAQNDAFFVDSGLTFEGGLTDTVTGLDHLEGETVAALADGAVHPPLVVSGGSITLNYEATKIQVGLPYTSKIQTERIEAGFNDGTAQGRTKRFDHVIFRVYRTGVFSIGYDENVLETIEVRNSLDPMGSPPSLISDDLRQTWNGPYETEGSVWAVSDDPLPFTLLAIIPSVEGTRV